VPNVYNNHRTTKQGRRAILGAGLATAFVQVPDARATDPVKLLTRQGEVSAGVLLVLAGRPEGVQMCTHMCIFPSVRCPRLYTLHPLTLT
jgi:hypothetical protein